MTEEVEKGEMKDVKKGISEAKKESKRELWEERGRRGAREEAKRD